jgi:hypothetical protein
LTGGTAKNLENSVVATCADSPVYMIPEMHKFQNDKRIFITQALFNLFDHSVCTTTKTPTTTTAHSAIITSCYYGLNGETPVISECAKLQNATGLTFSNCAVKYFNLYRLRYIFSSFFFFVYLIFYLI